MGEKKRGIVRKSKTDLQVTDLCAAQRTDGQLCGEGWCTAFSRGPLSSNGSMLAGTLPASLPLSKATGQSLRAASERAPLLGLDYKRITTAGFKRLPLLFILRGLFHEELWFSFLKPASL